VGRDDPAAEALDVAGEGVQERGSDAAPPRPGQDARLDGEAVADVRAVREAGAGEPPVELGEEEQPLGTLLGRRSSTVPPDSFGSTARRTPIQASRSASVRASRSPIIPTS
jgi:hypothetical protein